MTSGVGVKPTFQRCFLSMGKGLSRWHCCSCLEVPAPPPLTTHSDVRDELGLIDGCTCEPAARGTYSGTILPDCPHHSRSEG
jgi:hypothetical protein